MHARCLAHLYEAESGFPGCIYFNNAMSKYGRASFVFKTVYYVDILPTTEPQ